MSLTELMQFTVNFFALIGIFIVILYYWRELKAQKLHSYDLINALELKTRISHLGLLRGEDITPDYIRGLHSCIDIIDDLVEENTISDQQGVKK